MEVEVGELDSEALVGVQGFEKEQEAQHLFSSEAEVQSVTILQVN